MIEQKPCDSVRVKANGSMSIIVSHEQNVKTFAEFIEKLGWKNDFWSVVANYELVTYRYEANVSIRITPEERCRARQRVAEITEGHSVREHYPINDIYCHGVDIAVYRGVKIKVRYWHPELK